MNHHIEHDRNRFVESDGWTIAFNLNTTLQSCPIHHSSDYYRSQPIFVFRSLLGIPFDSLPPPFHATVSPSTATPFVTPVRGQFFRRTVVSVLPIFKWRAKIKTHDVHNRVTVSRHSQYRAIVVHDFTTPIIYGKFANNATTETTP